MMIISGITSFVLLGNDFWRISSLEKIIEKYNLSFTPLLRFLTAIWIWKNQTRFHLFWSPQNFKLPLLCVCARLLWMAITNKVNPGHSTLRDLI